MTLLRILVTGAAGAVGYHVAVALSRRGHFVRGFDLREPRLPGEHHRADLLDTAALQRAACGMDVLVHAAAVPDRQEFAGLLVPNNIIGTNQVLEVARLEGVPRVVNTSSIRVVGAIDWRRGRVGLSDGVLPADHYGVSKISGELLGEMYGRRFGICVISARLGWFVRNQREAEELRTCAEGPRIYLSHGDAQDFYARAVETPGVESATVYVTSHNGGDSAFDLAPAERLLGYRPRDTFPEGSQWSDSEDFPSPIGGPSLLPASPHPT